MQRLAVCLVLSLALTAASAGTWAVDIKSGDSVVLGKGEVVKDDVLAGAGQVSIASPVEGDVIAAGQSVSVAGRVKDSTMLAGGTVTLSGPVGNDSFLAGQTVVVSSKVEDNAYLAGSSVVLSEDGSVGKDLLAAGGVVKLMGKVGRHVRATAGQLTIGGEVGGDVFAQAGSLRLVKDAVIRGNLFYESANKAMIDPGARVMGKTVQRIPVREKAKPIFWRPFWWIGCLIAAVAFGAVLLALFPIRTQGAADRVRASFLKSLGLGVLVLIGAPIATILLAITIVGIPLAIAVLLVYMILLYAAAVFTALALGQYILSRSRDRVPQPFGSMILGLVILAVVSLIPFLGWLVKLAAVLVGLGGFLISWWTTRAATAVES